MTNYNGLTFRVGTCDFRVEEVANLLHKHDLLGQVSYHDCIIELEPELCEQRKHNVIIHELLHACLFEAGYDEQDEEQVRRLGNVLTQVLRDNSFEFLREEDVEKCRHTSLLAGKTGRIYCEDCNETIQEGLHYE